MNDHSRLTNSKIRFAKLRRFLPIQKTNFLQQLALTFTLGIVLLTILSSIAIATLTTKNLHKRFVDDSKYTTLELAKDSTLSLFYQSPEAAEEAARLSLNAPDVLAVAVYTHDKKLLFASDDSGLLSVDTMQWPDVLSIEYENADSWYYVAPVYSHQNEDVDSPFLEEVFEPELIGFVRVVVSKQTLHAMTDEILRGNLAVLAAISIVLLMILLFMTKRMTKPLQDLAAIMGLAEQGQYYVRANVQGPSDVVNMEHAFNTMMDVLEKREEELKSARDKALESARVKGEFAASVTHELRTPMNGVLGMLELLGGTGLSQQQTDYVNVARTSADALLLLIDDILDFSRMEAGKARIDINQFCLQDMVHDIIELLKTQANVKELALHYDIGASVPSLLEGADARIRQVLINLLGNAIKFTEVGEVSLTISADELEPVEAGQRVLLKFSVRDTGIGIPKDAQERIFEAFSQVDGSSTRKYGGSGLGLAICSQLLAHMGGEIGVESELGKGSHFWFSLPLLVCTDVVTLSSMNVEGIRVLVVEVNLYYRSELEAAFGSLGVEYKMVADKGTAIALLSSAKVREQVFDFIILDDQSVAVQDNHFIEHVRQKAKYWSSYVLLIKNAQSPFSHDLLDDTDVRLLNTPLDSLSLYALFVQLIEQRRQQDKPYITPTADESFVIKPNSRILVVEDNRTNQYVATGMLERLGCEAIIASNGQEALDIVFQSSYDVILMDIQMPGMTGYEVTKRIREQENPDARLPILAMTANTHQQEVDACLNAGMDDFVGKPLKLDVLRDKLQYWIPTDATPTTTHVTDDTLITEVAEIPVAVEQSSQTTDIPSNDVVDSAVIAELRETVGDVLLDMIQAFSEDMPQHMQSIKVGIDKQDSKAVVQAAHALKGSSRTFGADTFADYCYQLESLGSTNDFETAANVYQLLEPESEKVKAVLLQLQNPTQAQPIEVLESQSVNIMIVDDERDMRLVVRAALEREGYTIIEADSGESALSICKQRMPDLILMDAMMPGIDGFETCQQLHHSAEYQGTPILMVTALEDAGAIDKAFSAGATDYIPKPVNFGVLCKRIARLLEASQAKQHANQLAYHDPLTGLPNRTTFLQRLDNLVDEPERQGKIFAVLFIDLDRFKLVNDTLGHDIGDLLLKAVADRLTNSVRTSDLVARLGGDEFTIILDDIPSSESAARVAEKICGRMSESFVLLEQNMHVTISIGISIYPLDGRSSSELMKHADTAMFRAKEKRDGYQFYELGMESLIAKRVHLENELRKAIINDELVLYYQPQMDLATSKIYGMEALVRWQHPKRGMVPPAEFIQLAEETGLINKLGEWVLRHACLQLRKWLDKGFAPLKLSVNLSGRQLEDENLLETVSTILTETNVPGAMLELEITESAIMENPSNAIPVLMKLKEMNISLAIDDFGTGHSSLNYLRRFPVDTLKIDRSFVSDITISQNDASIIIGIIALAKSLNLLVIAEGVETYEQQLFLAEQNCDLIQGYYLYKPLPADEFEKSVYYPESLEQAG